MAIWPFGRSKKTKNAANADVIRSTPFDEKQVMSEKPSVDPMTPVTRTIVTGGRSTKESPKSSKAAKKDQKFFTSRNQSQSRAVPAERGDAQFGLTSSVSGGLPLSPIATDEPTTPRVRSKSRMQKRSTSPVSTRRPLKELGGQGGTAYRWNAADSKTSLGQDEDFTAIPIIPTLTPVSKSAPSSGRTSRQKSKKRSAEVMQRAEELKNKSRTSPVPIPKRPLSDASGLLVRESKRSPNLTRRPNSEISLPLAESLHDSATELPESTSYKVNAFDILAPRPTIKYNSNPRYLKSSHGKDREPVLPATDEDWSSKARMNELADSLDAHALRELMDRDRRRRERKKKVDAEKLARKLEKKAEREKSQKAPEKSKVGKGKEQEPRSESETTSAAPPNLDRKDPVPEALETVDDPFVSTEDELAQISRNSPVSPLDTPLEDPFRERSEGDDAAVETAQTVQYSEQNVSPPESPRVPRNTRRTSTSDMKYVSTPDIPEVPELPLQLQQEDRRDSEASSRKTGGGILSSIFRRGQRNARTSSERGRTTPSESGFSNLSRESFARTGVEGAASNEPSFVRTGGSGGPQILPQRSFRRSGTSVRTTSKFREDLPDVPAIPPVPMPTRATTPPVAQERSLSRPQSPPQSRVASPDAGSGPPSPFVDNPEMLSTEAAINAPLEDVHPALRQEVALSRGPSRRSSRRESAAAGTSIALLSQSLASVDSEGSWLSGRPSKRSSLITGRQSSNSISGGQFDEETRNSVTGSPLTFTRRTATAAAPSGNGATAGTSSISNQLHSLRHPTQTSEPASPEGRGSPTSERSVAPTPVRLSSLVTGATTVPAERSEAVLHTEPIARSPVVINRAEVTRSHTGLLDAIDPESKLALIETSEDQEMPSSEAQATGEDDEPKAQRPSSSNESPTEGISPETEQAEIKRATSVKLKGDRGHARQMSAGSARLLDISRRASTEGSKVAEGGRRGSSGNVAKMSDLTTTDSKDSNKASRLAQTTSAGDEGEVEASKEVEQ